MFYAELCRKIETNDIIEPNPELPVDSVEIPVEGDETIIPEDIVPDTEETDLPLDTSETKIQSLFYQNNCCKYLNYIFNK